MLTRRTALGGLLAAGAVSLRPARAQDVVEGLRGGLDATHEGLNPGAAGDQSAALRRALSKAEVAHQPLFFPPGRYEIAEIDLPAHAQLIGVPGRTQLVFRGGAFMLRARSSELLRLEGIALDGGGRKLDASTPALLDVDTLEQLVLEECEFAASAAGGATLRACVGRIEHCKVREVRTVGLELSQSRGMAVADNVVAECGDTGILVIRDSEGGDDTIVRGNRVTGIRAKSGGTGEYGNGINLSKANGVIVADNRVDNCAFSAIRCFSSDDIQVTGNIATRSGETGLYVEFAFEGAVVANNLVDQAMFGIAFANFMKYGGRLAVCSGNIVRNISGGARYPGAEREAGFGIGAEADTAITGNVVEKAEQGLLLGWGEYLRDVTANGNVVRNCPIGIGVTVVEGTGPAMITNNLISGAGKGAVVGMRWAEVATGDLLEGSAAKAYPRLTIQGNRVG